mmetsp:Transcript_20159/g.30005  ORF Transcript_20159/g.30005 Transcript_20159/m.30005 type:complete len:413 (-) Transcript_20159:505-1743(-)
MSSLLPHTKHIQCIYIITLSYLMQFCNSKTTYIPPPPHEGEFPTTTLSNGDIIPLVGLGGCSRVRKAHILSALDIGYRYFDTAQAYNWGYKEEDVGEAIHESSVDRDDIYVQSKIHPQDLGYHSTKQAVSHSLRRLQLDALDSMLIHKPRCWGDICQKTPEGTWQDSWVALEELYDEGIIHAIGICDVDDALLDELLTQRITPHVIQNWMDPFRQDVHIRQRCKEEGIQYQAYSSLGNQWFHHRGYTENPVLNHPTLVSIAQKYGVDVAQIVINWATRHGVAVIPASTNPTRQESNLNSFDFDLTEKEMLLIDSLDGKPPPPSPPTKSPEDPNKVSVVFQNQGHLKLKSYWIGSSNEEVHVGEIGAKDSMVLDSFHGHTFIFRNEGGEFVGQHTINKDHGSMQQHLVADSEL